MTHYTIDGGKVGDIHTALCRHYGIAVGTDEEGLLDINMITDYCLAEWPEGTEHQRWLDAATVKEIADWIIAAGPAYEVS